MEPDKPNLRKPKAELIKQYKGLALKRVTVGTPLGSLTAGETLSSLRSSH